MAERKDLKSELKQQTEVLTSTSEGESRMQLKADLKEQAQENYYLSSVVIEDLACIAYADKARIGDIVYSPYAEIKITQNSERINEYAINNTSNYDNPSDWLDWDRVNRENGERSGANAYYSPSKDEINIAGEAFNNLSTINKNVTLTHETVHRQHFLDDGWANIKASHNAIGWDRAELLSEKVALVAEAAYVVGLYQSIKAGLIAIEINGEDKPIECILSTFDEKYSKYIGNVSLKDVVLANEQFDLNNPEDLNRLVYVASEVWNNGRCRCYENKVFKSSEKGIVSAMSFTERCHFLDGEMTEAQLMEYKKIESDMLKDVYVGFNTSVDLSNCDNMQRFHTLSDKVLASHQCFSMIELDNGENRKSGGEKIKNIKECMNKLNEYMEKKGIKSDKEKDEYFAKFMKDVSCRNKPVDEEMLKIVLSYNNKIVYADGVIEEFNKDGTSTVTCRRDRKVNRKGKVVSYRGLCTDHNVKSTYSVYGKKNEQEQKKKSVVLDDKNENKGNNQAINTSNTNKTSIPLAMLYSQKTK